MATKEFYIIPVTQVFYEWSSELRARRQLRTHIGLQVSDNLDKSSYFEKPNVFNKRGSYAFTDASIDGLISNIHVAHQKGWRDSAEHLRFIIQELTDGFTRVMKDHQEQVIHVGGVTPPINQQDPDSLG